MARKTNHKKGAPKKRQIGKSLAYESGKRNKKTSGNENTDLKRERCARIANDFIGHFSIIPRRYKLNFSQGSKELEQSLSLKNINVSFVKELIFSDATFRKDKGADVGKFRNMSVTSWQALTTEIRRVVKDCGINFEQHEIEVKTLCDGRVRIFRKVFAKELLMNVQNIMTFLRKSKKNEATNVKQKLDVLEDKKQVKRKMLDLKEVEELFEPKAFFNLILKRLHTLKEENDVVPPNLTSSSGSLLWSVPGLKRQNWHQDWPTAREKGEKWKGYPNEDFYEGSVIVAAHKATSKQMFLHFKAKTNDSDKDAKKIGLYPGDAVMFDGDVIHAGDKWTGAERERVFLYVATNNNGRPKVPKIQVRDKNGDKNSQMVVSAGTHF